MWQTGSRLFGSNPAKLYFCTVLAFCSLYAAQPIQPVFQQEFALSALQATLFTTLMMLPLGFASMVYGFLLEAFPVRLVLRLAVLILGLLELLFCCSSHYLSLLIIRGLQGMVIPAIVTALISYISYTATRGEMQAAVARYIAATILGGFLGRFLSGLFTETFGWRFFFFLLAILLIVGCAQLRTLERDVNLQYSRPQAGEVFTLIRQGPLLWIYLAIFSVFFVFAGLLNFLPFELKRLNPSFGETGIGFMYSGYIMGILVSLNIRRLIAWFGSQFTMAATGLCIYALGIVGFMAPHHATMFAAMFVFCTGMFMVHALLSGSVNTLASRNRAIANGIYISFYYLGGTLGSFAPGVLYEHFSWRWFLTGLLCMVGAAMFCLLRLRSAVKRKGGGEAG